MSIDLRELEGKAAVVTGASRGIGLATAHALAEAGVGVVALARSAAALDGLVTEIRAAGGQAEAVSGDVTRYADVEAAVGRCVERFGSVDVLVNNAGLIEPISRLSESDPDAWVRVADVNYKGVYHGLRAALPRMEAQGRGVVVNVSSGAATSALEGWSHYCSSKAAALSLTRCADAETRAPGVRVVGLSPGTVATDMQVAIKASGLNPVSQLDPSVHLAPEWAARAVVWLCTSDAAEYRGVDVSLRDEVVRRRIGLAG